MATVEVRIISGADDTTVNNGTFKDDETVRFGERYSDTWKSSLRFVNVAVPQGEIITAAYIALREYMQSGTVCRFKIWGNDVDDAVAPTDDGEFDALVKTTASVDWDNDPPQDWEDMTTPSIVAIIQEVVDREGWVSGNAIQIMILDDGSDTDAMREYEDFDSEEDYCALLHIEYGVVAPSVTTDPATLVAAQASLNGTLDNDGGEACDVRFQYGETSDYGSDTEWQSGKESVVAFEQAITGLDPNKTYHFRAQARNSAGTVNGADRTFTTLVAVPTVTTDAATGLAAVSATLNGTLGADGGEPCECGFEWGLDTGYGPTTPTESKTTSEPFSQVIGGLIPNTVYHFRALATNSAGTDHGDDETFTTALVISRAHALARREL